MNALITLFFLSSLILLIIGFFNPKKSLFWLKGNRTKSKSLFIYSLILFVLILFIVNYDTPKNDANLDFDEKSISENKDIQNTSSETEWYIGGTLQNATIEEWKNADDRNKLATCGDWVTVSYKQFNIKWNLVKVKIDATDLMTCIDEAVKGDAANNADVKLTEVVAMCGILLFKEKK